MCEEHLKQYFSFALQLNFPREACIIYSFEAISSNMNFIISSMREIEWKIVVSPNADEMDGREVHTTFAPYRSVALILERNEKYVKK